MRNPLRRALLAVGTAGLVTLSGLALSSPAQAATVNVSGYVYRDYDNDGVKDAGEPGVAGIRVHVGSGAPTTTTAADGSYALTVNASAKIRIETGWFRSQCNSMTCTAGPGADNDFNVNNQFVEYTLGTVSVTDINAGLVPDWPGSDLNIPAPVGGVVPANATDVAARLSAGTNCPGTDSYAICHLNDTFTMIAQVNNQGTNSLSGITGQIYAPGGDCITGLSLDTNSSPTTITSVTPTPALPAGSCVTGVIGVSFAGTLPAGGAIRVVLNGKVVSGPGTPGCVVGAPAAPCATGEPQGRAWIFRVNHINETSEADSVFNQCTNVQDCPTGLHDKRRDPDDVDPAGHNVDASAGGTTTFDLKMEYHGYKQPASVHPGDTVYVRAWAQNVGANLNQANANSTVTMYFPKGTTITSLPPNHSLLACVSDLTSPSWEKVTCTYKGPLAPEVAGIAFTVGIKIPATWTVGTNYRTVACAAPVAGQTGEVNPVGASCDLTTTPGSTATNNDDFKDFAIV